MHPTEIAYDIITAQRTLDALKDHPSFGFNFDPSHFIHQFVNPVAFIEEFPTRIFHCHVKDSRVQLTGQEQHPRLAPGLRRRRGGAGTSSPRDAAT